MVHRQEQRCRRQHLQQGVEPELQRARTSGILPWSGEQPGRERVQNDHQQPEHVVVPDLRVDPFDIPEHGVIAPPGCRNDYEADQERHIALVIVPYRHHELGQGGPVGDGQVESEQGDRDGDHRVRKGDQAIGRARLEPSYVVGHPSVPLRIGRCGPNGTTRPWDVRGAHDCHSGGAAMAGRSPPARRLSPLPQPGPITSPAAGAFNLLAPTGEGRAPRSRLELGRPASSRGVPPRAAARRPRIGLLIHPGARPLHGTAGQGWSIT